MSPTVYQNDPASLQSVVSLLRLGDSPVVNVLNNLSKNNLHISQTTDETWKWTWNGEYHTEYGLGNAIVNATAEYTKKLVQELAVMTSIIQDKKLEQDINTLSNRGLQIWQNDMGFYCWEWQGCSNISNELGDCIATAIHWYFGLIRATDLTPVLHNK